MADTAQLQSATAYESATELREAHARLLEALDRELGEEASAQAEAEALARLEPRVLEFLQRGAATGVYLEETKERTACQDGVDNDAAPGIDFDGGVSIHGACTGLPGGCPPGVSDPEGDGVPNPDPQCVGRPFFDNEAAGSACGLGTELALLLPGLAAWRRRRTRRPPL